MAQRVFVPSQSRCYADRRGTLGKKMKIRYTD